MRCAHKYRRPVAIAASGKMTTPAIVAAALEEKCSALYLTGGLQSFASLLEEEEPAEAFANWIPDSVPGQDLAGLVKQISPRPVRQRSMDSKRDCCSLFIDTR